MRKPEKAAGQLHGAVVAAFLAGLTVSEIRQIVRAAIAEAAAIAATKK